MAIGGNQWQSAKYHRREALGVDDVRHQDDIKLIGAKHRLCTPFAADPAASFSTAATIASSAASAATTAQHGGGRRPPIQPRRERRRLHEEGRGRPWKVMGGRA